MISDVRRSSGSNPCSAPSAGATVRLRCKDRLGAGAVLVQLAGCESEFEGGKVV